MVEEFLKRNINSSYTSNTSGIVLAFRNIENLRSARDYLEQNNFTTSGSKYTIIQEGNNLNLEYTQNYLSEIVDYAVEQNLVALRNRVNELGVSEPIVQREGKGRIVVELYNNSALSFSLHYWFRHSKFVNPISESN